MFGENFTAESLTEEAVNIGDRFRIGTAELVVTQPRVPCYKLGRDDMVKRFLASGRTGFDFSLAREAEVGPGDEIRLIGRDENNVGVPQITRSHVSWRKNPAEAESVRRATWVEALPQSWRRYFLDRLEKLG